MSHFFLLKLFRLLRLKVPSGCRSFSCLIILQAFLWKSQQLSPSPRSPRCWRCSPPRCWPCCRRRRRRSCPPGPAWTRSARSGSACPAPWSKPAAGSEWGRGGGGVAAAAGGGASYIFFLRFFFFRNRRAWLFGREREREREKPAIITRSLSSSSCSSLPLAWREWWRRRRRRGWWWWWWWLWQPCGGCLFVPPL